MRGHRDRISEHQRDAVRYALGVGHVDHRVEDQQELITPEPGDHVAGAHGRGEPRGDGAQDLIADGVAERIVEEVESVQVHEHRGEASLAGTLGADDRAPQQVEGEGAVREARERIVEHAALGLLLDGPLVGGVAHRARDTNSASGIVALDGAPPEHPQPASILVPHAMLGGESVAHAGHLRRDVHLELRLIRRVDAGAPLIGRALDLLRRKPQGLAPPRREAHAVLSHIPIPQRVLGVAGGECQPFRRRGGGRVDSARDAAGIWTGRAADRADACEFLNRGGELPPKTADTEP